MMTNLWSVDDINAALATNLKFLGSNFRVVIDSRKVKKGDIFIALRGANFNANLFVDQAIKSGAALCITEDVFGVVEKKHSKLLLIDNTKAALIKLARYRRKKVKGIIIGITGSVGKSSMKELLYYVLCCYGKSYASYGNYNGQIGLPLSLVNAPIDCVYYIFELGMSEPGEMAIISKILTPDIAILLNAKEVHQQSFADLTDIAKAKLEITAGMPQKSLLILNNEIRKSLYTNIVCQKNINVKLFNADHSCIIEKIKTDNNCKIAYIKLVNKTLTQAFSKELGDHLIFNTQAIFLCLQNLQLDLAIAYDAIKSFKPLKGRGEVNYLSDNIILIDESYNSSPIALKAAISSTISYRRTGNRVIAVIGDMLELGKKESSIHENININDVDLLFCVGILTKSLFNKAKNKQKGGYYKNIQEILPIFVTYIKRNDIILVKGSRSIKLDLLVDQIKSVYG